MSSRIRRARWCRRPSSARLTRSGLYDQRRPEAERLVRALEERCRRGGCARSSRLTETGAGAHPARLRRAPLRSPRRGRKRRRPERLRLGRRHGPQRRRRVPPAPPRRRPKPDRRHRPFRRGRDATPDRRGVRRVQSGCRRRRRCPLDPRGSRPNRRRKLAEIPTSLVVTAGTMLFSNHAVPPNLKSLVGRIAPRPVLFIYGGARPTQRQGAHPRLLRCRGSPRPSGRSPVLDIPAASMSTLLSTSSG